MARVSRRGIDWRGQGRRLRLWAGVVLFVYVASHLLNHALGLISLDALNAGGRAFTAVWRHPLATLLLYGAALLHACLGLWALVQRRSLRMAWRDASLIVLGLLVPVLLAAHVLATRGAHELFGVVDSYTYELIGLWVVFPFFGVMQAVALVVVWLHGVMGLHGVLRLKPWYPGWQPWLQALALLWPAAALAGYVTAGKEVMRLAADKAWFDRQVVEANVTPEVFDFVLGYKDPLALFFLAIYVAIVLWHLARDIGRKRVSRLTVTYPDGRSVMVPVGASVLEASRIGGIPHASVCGGRGRCSTCRIRIVGGEDRLPPPDAEETKVLDRIGATGDLRLACQLRPTGDVAVMPLLAATATPREVNRPGYLQGSEREVAVLFADLRAFTAVAESKLPYDVVFLLNQYFRFMGEAVEQAGGRLDKFIGDGVMALFGIRQGANAGSFNALRAAREMSRALDRLNRELADELDEPLRMGIGIHAGHAIVGEMGYRNAVSLTAVGDTVNIASRLEALTKEFGCQLVVSRRTVELAGVAADQFESREVRVRGRASGLQVLISDDAGNLALPEAPAASAPAMASAAGAG